VTQFTDRRGKVTTFSYDGLNRRTFAGFGTQAGPIYESTVTYSYDAGNRLTQAVDSVTGTITRGYDNLNRLTSESTPQGTVSYTYDNAGRRATMTVAGQPVVNYSFDNANRLTQITQGTTAVAFGYDTAGRRTTLTLPNGVVMSYSYDSASQLTGITYTLGATSLGNLTYGYDNAGKRITMGGSFARTGLPNAVTATAYNANNQLTQWGTANLFYDPNGNMTSDGVNSFVWNARNQLASMNLGANAFQYDPFGRRVAKTISGSTTNYLYDRVNVAQELAGGVPTANLLSGGIDEVFTRTDAAGARHFLTDALGSSLALADSTGTLQTQYTYEAFGSTTVTGQASSNAYEYTGRENDATGLYFYRARYYSPSLQRFVTEDPLTFLSGVNSYCYVADNPISYVDPSGLDKDPPCSRAQGGFPLAYTGTAIYVPGLGLGPALSLSYVPGSQELFIAPGIGASLGHTFSVGPLIGPSPSGVLPGWGLNFGYNATPWTGTQAAGNSSGTLAGPSFGVPGFSATLTYGFCIRLHL